MNKPIVFRRNAIEQGLLKYFTGKPCKHGHVTERYTATSACVQCAFDYAAAERAYIKKRRAEIAGGEA